MKHWYKVEKSGAVYYTNEAPFTRVRKIVGEGTAKGTPKEILDLVNNDFNSDDPVNSMDGVYSQEVEDHKNFCELPPGTYVYKYGNYPLPDRLVPVDFRSDRYIEMPKITQDILRNLDYFLDNEEIYRGDGGDLYKTAFLLWGPGGTGKTAVIRHIVRTKLAHAVTIVIGRSIPDVQFLNHIKETLKDKLKVFILEEFTHFCLDPLDMESVLNFLDGETTIDNSITFATTNYPETLPHNMVSRHSRIEFMHEISYPDPQERKLLIQYYLKEEPTEEDVKLTEKMTTDSIKAICRVKRIKKIAFKQAKEEVDLHLKTAKNNFKGKESKIGF